MGLMAILYQPAASVQWLSAECLLSSGITRAPFSSFCTRRRVAYIPWLGAPVLTFCILRQRLGELDLVSRRIGNTKVSVSPGLMNDPLRHPSTSSLELRVKFFQPIRENMN